MQGVSVLGLACLLVIEEAVVDASRHPKATVKGHLCQNICPSPCCVAASVTAPCCRCACARSLHAMHTPYYAHFLDR